MIHQFSELFSQIWLLGVLGSGLLKLVSSGIILLIRQVGFDLLNHMNYVVVIGYWTTEGSDFGVMFLQVLVQFLDLFSAFAQLLLPLEIDLFQFLNDQSFWLMALLFDFQLITTEGSHLLVIFPDELVDCRDIQFGRINHYLPSLDVVNVHFDVLDFELGPTQLLFFLPYLLRQQNGLVLQIGVFHERGRLVEVLQPLIYLHLLLNGLHEVPQGPHHRGGLLQLFQVPIISLHVVLHELLEHRLLHVFKVELQDLLLEALRILEFLFYLIPGKNLPADQEEDGLERLLDPLRGVLIGDDFV